jgi:IS5 family transposase
MQPSLWESVLPEICLRLPAELERVDAWLDDERFFAPFVPFFDPRLGRTSIPMETYLRLMFLKHRYRLGYETLCAEVSDSISWRRFCRIDIDARLPHPTTLMKLTTRCGQQAVAALNEQLLAKAVEARVVKTGKVRADTTVVPANVDYPTDTGLPGPRGEPHLTAGDPDQGRRCGCADTVSRPHQGSRAAGPVDRGAPATA